jgi:hypothetical protein
MPNAILRSIHGKRFGIGPQGELLLDKGFGPKILPVLLGNLAAAGTPLTSSTAETALGKVTIPANTLQPGSLIQIRFQGITPTTNSTDTLAIKAYIGGLAGTALISMAATDVADNNVFQGEYELAVRTIGASGTIVGVGTYKSIPAAEGTMTIKDDILASTAIDTTVDQDVTVSGTWSANSASDIARLDFLRVIVF